MEIFLISWCYCQCYLANNYILTNHITDHSYYQMTMGFL